MGAAGKLGPPKGAAPSQNEEGPVPARPGRAEIGQLEMRSQLGDARRMFGRQSGRGAPFVPAAPQPAGFKTSLLLSLLACDLLAIDKSLEPVTLVLAEDGTIVDDEDYFLCLPDNTKFVALACNETWKYSNTDGGTAWLSQESFEAKDETDSGTACRWKNLAQQLRGDLSSIILLAEEDLQVLIDVPCSDLAQELSQSLSKTQDLQNTLQQVLDHREEARQSRQLLQLYLQALEREGGILSKQESEAPLDERMDEVDKGVADHVTLSSHILTVLKEKSSPELSLSNQDLELVTKEPPEALARALNWNLENATAVQRACQQQLTLRLQQIQSLHALHSISTRKNSLTEEPLSPKRAK